MQQRWTPYPRFSVCGVTSSKRFARHALPAGHSRSETQESPSPSPKRNMLQGVKPRGQGLELELFSPRTARPGTLSKRLLAPPVASEDLLLKTSWSKRKRSPNATEACLLKLCKRCPQARPILVRRQTKAVVGSDHGFWNLSTYGSSALSHRFHTISLMRMFELGLISVNPVLTGPSSELVAVVEIRKPTVESSSCPHWPTISGSKRDCDLELRCHGEFRGFRP